MAYEATVGKPSSHKCAFCKHWYDPTNQAISPKAPAIGLWNYDADMRKKCLLRNNERRGIETCNRFESKL